jgi:ribosomal protein S18 acetylase RimI-like enzyme
MEIKKAGYEDLPEILRLQKLAYLSEAKLHGDYTLQPLTQTIEELQAEFAEKIILKLLGEKNNIVGSVRAYEENGRVYIGKLMVHPDYQKRGWGTCLLQAMERLYKHKIFELFTSGKSENNLRLYKKNGYKEYKRQRIAGNIELIFMEK